MKFRTNLQLSGTTATGISVPPDIVEDLGHGKRPPVRITINGHTYRSTVCVMGGEFMLPVAAEHRLAAGIKAGDEIEVELHLDTDPREIAVPPDLAAAMEGELRNSFDALSYSNRLWHVLQTEGAKTPETRARRIAKSIQMLREGKKP